VLGVLAKSSHVGRQHLHSVANSHCGHPASKRIHPGFASISQHQSQVRAVNGNDETWHSGPRSDIHDRPSNANKGVYKLARMRNDIRDWQCAESAETLGCPKDVFKAAGFWHVMNVVPNMQKARHTAGPSH
jgi:hypothetical protein